MPRRADIIAQCERISALGKKLRQSAERALEICEHIEARRTTSRTEGQSLTARGE